MGLAVAYETVISYTGLSTDELNMVVRKGTDTLKTGVADATGAAVVVTKAPEIITDSPTGSPTMKENESFATHQKQFSIIASAMAISIVGFLKTSQIVFGILVSFRLFFSSFCPKWGTESMNLNSNLIILKYVCVL